jgi:hypothetical protein
MLLWLIYFTGKNANYTYRFLKDITFQLLCILHSLHINATLQQKNIRLFVAFFGCFAKVVYIYLHNFRRGEERLKRKPKDDDIHHEHSLNHLYVPGIIQNNTE